jgi:hypothetical protein
MPGHAPALSRVPPRSLNASVNLFYARSDGLLACTKDRRRGTSRSFRSGNPIDLRISGPRLCWPPLFYRQLPAQILEASPARSNTGVFSKLLGPVPEGISSVACRNDSVVASKPSTVSFA